MPRSATRTRWNENRTTPGGVSMGAYETVRDCPRCGNTYPATTDYFYRRPSNGRWCLCHPCEAAYRRRPRTNRARRIASPTGARTFGVEIEFTWGRNYTHRTYTDVVSALAAQGLVCRNDGYTHAVSHSQWKVVSDGSVHNGGELVSPVLSGEDGFEQIRKATAALRSLGAKVNRSTGLHVHHDARDLDLRAFRRLFRIWYNAQSAIDTLVAPSRRGRRNGFCLPLQASEVTAIEGLSGLDRETINREVTSRVSRYRTLNVCSFPRYGTVEVRQHQGTLDAEKILAWVRFGQSIIEAARGDEDCSSFQVFTAEALLGRIDLADEIRSFLNTRSARLAGTTA